MNAYGVRDVEKLLGLSRSTIQAFIDAGFVTPERGSRNQLRFSFRDLIVLRTAQALAEANVPARRITRSLRELRKHLPETMPLAGLSIGAVADTVIVREGGGRWQADSGQYLLAFEGDPSAGVLSVVQPKPVAPGGDWYSHALAIEGRDRNAAIAALERAIAEDPSRVDARIDLGRLLHESRRLADAERVYREALSLTDDAVVHFNLGVLHEDMGRKADAVRDYEMALAADAQLADAHYNLALLCEALGRPKLAIRHMARYRQLVASG